MDPAQPRQLEMFVDASELSAEAAEALRSIDFAQLLEQTANLSEHNNSLRQRNHINVQRFTLAGAAHGPLDGDPNSWDPRR
jgi:hypothetical protein